MKSYFHKGGVFMEEFIAWVVLFVVGYVLGTLIWYIFKFK